jgi:cold shock CspA family protein
MPKASEQRQTGRVLSFTPERGFGWIDGQYGHIWFGARELRRCGIDSVVRGDWIEYALLDKGDRQEAVDLELTVPTSARDRRAELLSKRAPSMR